MGEGMGRPGGVSTGFRWFQGFRGSMGFPSCASDQEYTWGLGAVESQIECECAGDGVSGWGFRGVSRGFLGFPVVFPLCASDQEDARGLGAVESQNLVRGFLAVLLSLL